MTLSLKARFYARVTPLDTTTAVVQSHRRKNSENRRQSQTCLNFAEVHPVLRKPKNSENRYVRSLFSWFFLDEKESLKGITVFVGRLAGCLHTSSITTNGVNTLISVSFSARGFQGFCRIRIEGLKD